MASSITWIDHDAEARDRSMRLLALFDEKETRDELGLGSVRDSFADQLFPGTSTIQTRLRYMLFIPWIYQKLERGLEAGQFPPGEFDARAKRMELDLVSPLLESEDRSGVFGKMAGRELKRLPSSVYWSGLGSWGIRQIDLSRDQYHRRIGQLCHRRVQESARGKERARQGDFDAGRPDARTITWHQRLPSVPDDFPGTADLQLSADEAAFLLDRIRSHHADSLLARLAANSAPAEVDVPWEHPDLESFSVSQKVLLAHARLFSVVMQGAAFVYNLLLAEQRDWDSQVTFYREKYRQWRESLSVGELREWDMGDFWGHVVRGGHRITRPTQTFVEEWVQLAAARPDTLISDPDARHLVEHRERRLKKARSRFRNQRALEQWGGKSGIQRMDFRWGTAKVLLYDLHSGLNGAPN